MRKIILIFAITLAFVSELKAQDNNIFKAKLTSSEEGVGMVINFYDKDVVVEGQELLGCVAGYIFADYDYRKWIIVDADITDESTAELTVVNDYGSEDLTALLKVDSEGKYTLKQLKGSAIKFSKEKKWLKIPKNLIFTGKEMLED